MNRLNANTIASPKPFGTHVASHKDVSSHNIDTFHGELLGIFCVKGADCESFLNLTCVSETRVSRSM